MKIAKKVNRDDIVELLNKYSATNESIRQFLKPKPMEEVLKNIEQ